MSLIEVENLEKTLALFLTILQSLKMIPASGKVVHAQLIGTYLKLIKRRAVKQDYQKQFRNFVQYMVDSVKNSLHINLITNDASKADRLALDTFLKNE